MTIPDYQTLMLPVLKLAADNEEHKFSQAVEQLGNAFALTAEEKRELLPSGSQAVIYIQAKRWEGSVGRPEIQKFAGALQGQRARKGVFITTSSFTKEAREYASRIESKLILED